MISAVPGRAPLRTRLARQWASSHCVSVARASVARPHVRAPLTSAHAPGHIRIDATPLDPCASHVGTVRGPLSRHTAPTRSAYVVGAQSRAAGPNGTDTTRRFQSQRPCSLTSVPSAVYLVATGGLLAHSRTPELSGPLTVRLINTFRAPPHDPSRSSPLQSSQRVPGEADPAVFDSPGALTTGLDALPRMAGTEHARSAIPRPWR